MRVTGFFYGCSCFIKRQLIFCHKGFKYGQKKTPLSAGLKNGWKTGFEPATSGTTIQRSNQLSYNHHLYETPGFRPVDHCPERWQR